MSDSNIHTARDMPARFWDDEDNPQKWQAPGLEQGRSADVDRAKGPAERALSEEIIAWRQHPVYIGDISAGSSPEVGLGAPPVGGAMLRRVTLRARADFTGGAQVDLQRRDFSGVATLIAKQNFANQQITAHILFEVWHSSEGMRFEPEHEATLLWAVGGVGLTGVTAYADWYVGL